MGQPYIGEIRMFAGDFAPNGWAFCDGQMLSIAENDTLFIVLGTMYGGDGEETFALPDLRGRTPVHMGTRDGVPWQQGQMEGTEEVTLTTQNLPPHQHGVIGASSATAHTRTPGPGLSYAVESNDQTALYSAAAPDASLAANAGPPAAAGGSQPHTNMQPYLGVNFIISLYGRFPSET